MSELEYLQEQIETLSKRIDLMERVIGKSLSQEKARKLLGVSRNTIIKYRKDGLLPYTIVGNKVSISLSDIQKLLSLR